LNVRWLLLHRNSFASGGSLDVRKKCVNHFY
jgi:hypothetical protein